MKRLLIIAIIILSGLSGCSGDTITSQENAKEVNELVQGLMANSQQVDFQVEPSRADWAPDGLAQIREMAFGLIPAIKVTGKMNGKVDLHKPGMAFFKWSDTSIYIDLKSSDPQGSIYIESKYGIHEAEANKESVDKVIEFAKKSLLL
ncbi:hypothetical protein OXPF_32670 [Oxobacter pfennigii]|uniref:DUF302 domain-containing protein n=1 Tax=Oxobacter pfennigii TaxID=36849 RepID=A0A0P8WLG4_9CLOT|nr:hypothetical protein [Oxobacter pfennigii]KPU43253.1 hypothetical protein OXPF_32670 [Oxobacter pfennigii]